MNRGVHRIQVSDYGMLSFELVRPTHRNMTLQIIIRNVNSVFQPFNTQQSAPWPSNTPSTTIVAVSKSQPKESIVHKETPLTDAVMSWVVFCDQRGSYCSSEVQHRALFLEKEARCRKSFWLPVLVLFYMEKASDLLPFGHSPHYIEKLGYVKIL